MQSQQREGMEYEFDVVGDMNGATLVVTKSRISKLNEAVIKRPGPENIVPILREWLTDGAPLPSAPDIPPANRSAAQATLAAVCTQSVELARKLIALHTAEGADAADSMNGNIERARECYGDKTQPIMALQSMAVAMKEHNSRAIDLLSREQEAAPSDALDEPA